jgi:NitT/TauT family transport system substrate-binding protein
MRMRRHTANEVGTPASRKTISIMQMKRGAFLAATAATVSLARPGGAQAPALQKITVASAQDADAVGCLYAQESGLFRKAGLDVTIMPNTSGSAVASAVIGGAVDIGKSSLTALITAVSKGIPLVLVAPSALYNVESPVTGTIVRYDSPLKTARDLNGKTVAVQSVRGSLQLATMAWVDQNGGDSTTIKFLELPPQAGLIALDAGRVDACTLANPYMTQALSEKKARVIGWSSEAIAKRFLLTAYFTTKAFAAKNPDAVAHFAQALAQSAAYLNTHHGETAAMTARFTGALPEVVAKLPPETFATVLDPRDVQPYIDASVKYKFIPDHIDAATFIAQNPR